jgi:hypothetical protein
MKILTRAETRRCFVLLKNLDPDLTVLINTRTRRANTGFVLEIRVNHKWRKRRGAWISDALGNPKLRPSVGAKVSGLVALFLSCYRKIVVWSWFVSDFVDEFSGFVFLFCLFEEQV